MVVPFFHRLLKNRRFGPNSPAVPEDIPLAHRSHPVVRQSDRKRRRSRLATRAVTASLLIAVAVVFSGPLRQRMFPPQKDGFQGGLSTDGRLLGHFPYPEANDDQLVALSPGLKLHQDAADAYHAMEQAAAAEGVSLSLLSAFRSIAEQEQLFFAIKAQRNQSALNRAKVSAPPGFSEHSTGYAIDVGDASQPNTNLSPAFTQTKAYRWLSNNAARFQFTLSFPQGNPQGVNFEPWHWRYEGSVEALRLFEPAQRLWRNSRQT
ncbi:MAG: D-alanyl-D-alanine carboxypeptidase family protein [Cyanobacteriota bacterium]|jgi:D-alanyl-D-alanine carboxypeptidase